MKTKKKNFDYFESLVNMSVYALEEANLLKSISSISNPRNWKNSVPVCTIWNIGATWKNTT